MDKGVAKIKEFTLFLIGVGDVCTIRCAPQQKWKFERTEALVRLERGNVVLRASPTEFDEKWEVINE